MSYVLRAISNIMAAVGSVEKRGKNQFHNYDYATAADISHALQPLLAKEGLVILQTEIDRQFTNDGALLEIAYEFTLTHVNGEVYPQKIQQTGMSSARNTKGGMDDKAANKCHTAARKYFLLALFQIPTGDYDDADKEEDKPAPKPMQAKARQADDTMPIRPGAKNATAKTEDEGMKAVGESLSKMIAEAKSEDAIDEILNRPDFEDLSAKKPAWAQVVAGRAKQKRAELTGEILAAG